MCRAFFVSFVSMCELSKQKQHDKVSNHWTQKPKCIAQHSSTGRISLFIAPYPMEHHFHVGGFGCHSILWAWGRTFEMGSACGAVRSLCQWEPQGPFTLWRNDSLLCQDGLILLPWQWGEGTVALFDKILAHHFPEIPRAVRAEKKLKSWMWGWTKKASIQISQKYILDVLSGVNVLATVWVICTLVHEIV